MDLVDVGVFRLWNHVKDDVVIGNIYILRGLKVATERTFNGERYVNDRNGDKKLISDARTAFEDVSDQQDITTYFA